jgi:S1-C subfamily serine protease
MVNWAFPDSLQPKQEKLNFDLATAFEAVVQVRATIPEAAFTASILGTERVGNGVVIDESGLVLTIGYLITEADSVWLTNAAGAVVPATVLAYDFATGFGLLLPLGRLAAPMLPRGNCAAAAIGDEVIVVSHGGSEHTLTATIADKREFAGYWEYVLDEAIFTTPPHPQWGGAALLDKDGRLLGIGSLLVEDAVRGQLTRGNMIVPIDLIEPILPDLVKSGRSGHPPRPWLGMYTSETDGQLVVVGIAPGGPANRAGVDVGDAVLQVGRVQVGALAELFREIWSLGGPGTQIPLTLSRNGKTFDVRIRSADRSNFLFKPALH